MLLSRGVFIVAVKRTPFGSFGGKLKDHTATDLCEIAAKAALASGNIRPEIIDSTVIGHVAPTALDASYIARHVALRSKIPVDRPALTINRLCGSGLQAIISATLDILMGDSEIVMSGGAEGMSQCPFVLRRSRFGVKLGDNLMLEDALWDGLMDHHIKTPSGVTAETLGAKYGITREECDLFAIQSQQRWKTANDAGAFKDELTPIEMMTKKGVQVLDTDECPRETPMAALARMPPVFVKDGLVSAGNSAGLSDGAGVVILASEKACQKHNLTPLARLVSYNVVGCDPHIQGIGAVLSTRNALDKAGLKLNDMDVCEVQESFAAQSIAISKELELDPAKTNINGGAIAIGNPLAASGSRMASHVVYELRRRKLKYGISTQPIGGGQGVSLILENMA